MIRVSTKSGQVHTTELLSFFDYGPAQFRCLKNQKLFRSARWSLCSL